MQRQRRGPSGQALLARAPASCATGRPGAQATLTRLTDPPYTDGALTPVAGNVTEAVARVDFADEQLKQSATDLAAADRGKAALAAPPRRRAGDRPGGQPLLDALDEERCLLHTAAGST